jgi:lipopolysaccharide transport system permease protein
VSPPHTIDPPPTTVVVPPKGWQGPGLRELWRYRELLRVLSMRDVRIRYKQTILGMGWAVLQPFMAMVVFSIVLNGAAGVQSEPGIPYPIFTYSGLVLWLYFSEALTRASKSLVTNNMLVSKIYFPRLVAPLSGVLAPLVDFVIAFVILIVMMVVYRVPLSWPILLAPVFVLAAILCATAFGVGLSALNVEYRDIGYAVPLAVQLWLFLTPVVYPATNVTGALQVIYSLNPMAGIISGFRWAVIGGSAPNWLQVATSSIVLLVVLVAGELYFRRVERTFADAI